MAPPRTVVTTSSCSLLQIYRPRKDERLRWPGWLTYSERTVYTRKWSPISCRSSAGQQKLDRYSRLCESHFLGHSVHYTHAQLEVHSVECIYLRQRCLDASKPRVTASTGAQYHYVGFSRRNKIPHCSAYDSKPCVAVATRAQYGFFPT